MNGLDFNIGTSVFKREVKSIEEVVNQLKSNGWSQTGSLGNRIKYFENSKLNITVVDGVGGVLVFPSGPIRGRLFGSSGLSLNQTSVIGAGSNTSSGIEKQNKQVSERVEDIT